MHSRAMWAAYGMAALIVACIMLSYVEGVRATEEPPRTPHGVPMSGVATWYGARCPRGVSVYGRTDTCTPYTGNPKINATIPPTFYLYFTTIANYNA